MNTDQLRTTALIFAEHEFLQKENALLEKQIDALQQSMETAEKMITDYQTALRGLERNHTATKNTSEAIVENCREELTKQKKKTRRRTVMGIVGGVAIGVIVGGMAF